MRLPLVAALLLLLATASSHAAAPACPEAATLAGRRALAAVRDAIDAACPCDQPRKPYQRCAKAQLTAALDAGTLPAACGKTAKQTVKTSSCGLRKKVPCGRIRTSDGAITCGLAAPKRCRDNRRFDATACTGETHCSDVVGWTAGSCHDPRDFGPYAPGVRVRTFTKPSARDGSPRALETVIWYPAAAGAGPLDAENGGVLDAPVDASGGPYPVVMFSHGSCGYARQSLYLTPLLASWGFVVVSVPHPGNQIFEFPECGLAEAQTASFQERVPDIRFVLDRMLELSSTPGSPFLGVLDGERIGMMGHSFGGMTTYRVAVRDARIKAAVPIAPPVFGEPTLDVPTLTVLGKIDSVVDPEPPLAAFAAAARPKYLAVIENAGHYVGSDSCFPRPDCKPPETLTQDEAHALVVRYVVPFLKRHLAGDESFRSLLETPMPGVELTAEP